MVDINQIIADFLYLVITVIGAFVAAQVKKMKDDRNSFYSKQAAFMDHQLEALKQQMGQEQYNHAKQVAQDIIYKVEQLGKELAWDAVTKHSKATEWISQATGLTDERIFDIIKTTVGMINAAKQAAPASQVPAAPVSNQAPAADNQVPVYDNQALTDVTEKAAVQ